MRTPIGLSSHRFDVLGHAYRGQPLLAATAGLLLLMMIPSALALGLDARTLNGINVWIKPLKFQLSLAVQLLTVAWVLLCLPREQRDSRLVRGLSGLMVAAAVFEIAYIMLQASRGEASHFNVATPTARLMYALMGLGAVILVGTSGWIGALVLRHGRTSDPIVFAAGLGLLLGSALGGIAGAYLSAQSGHWVGGEPTDLGGLPIVGWSRSGGDLRVAHFIGLHLAQVLPATAWIGTRILPGRFQSPLLILFAAIGVIATGAAFVQAFLGVPLVPSG